MDLSGYLTVDGLCAVLSIGKTKAYEMMKSGELDSCKLAGKWMVSGKSVDDYIASEIEKTKNENAHKRQ